LGCRRHADQLASPCSGGSTLDGIPLGNTVGSLLNATNGVLRPLSGGLVNITGALLGGEFWVLPPTPHPHVPMLPDSEQLSALHSGSQEAMRRSSLCCMP